VLVNKGTASAAEVLTGALQDNKRGVVVGEKTFGKGIIQTIVPLSDGSAVAVTVAAYQTPNEVSINKVMPRARHLIFHVSSRSVCKNYYMYTNFVSSENDTSI
jgi:hypothetical protein